MTSASELFYSRRFRPVRDPEPAILFPAVDSDRGRERERDHHHCLYRRRRSPFLYHQDVSSLRQLVHGGHPHLCRNFGIGISDSDEQGTSSSSGERSRNGEFPSGVNRGPSFARTDRLPGSVLQARARLLERLRGVSLSESSRHSTAAAGTSPWNALAGAEASKPAGLSAESISSLRRELFSGPEGTGGGAAPPPEISQECCICLEPFRRGDSLLPLPCGHRFHLDCLCPWLRGRGDCPYCRSPIVSVVPAAHVTSSEIPL